MITKKQLTFIILRNLALTVVAVGIALSVVIYSANHISKISETISAKKKTSFALEKRSETYSNLKNDFTKLGDSETVIENALVPSDDISSFISALEALGLRNGVNQSYQFGQASPPTDPGGLPISSIDYSIKIRAPLFSLISYLKDFENMPYFSGISNINMASGAPEGLNGISDVSINARLYAKQSI